MSLPQASETVDSQEPDEEDMTEPHGSEPITEPDHPQRVLQRWTQSEVPQCLREQAGPASTPENKERATATRMVSILKGKKECGYEGKAGSRTTCSGERCRKDEMLGFRGSLNYITSASTVLPCTPLVARPVCDANAVHILPTLQTQQGGRRSL